MPPTIKSRNRYCYGVQDSNGTMFLTDRVPYRFKDFPDNISHIVEHGDTLFTIAGRYYRSIERGCGLWWILADFQPIPILDPTRRLAIGRIIYGPSLQTIFQEIFNEDRRRLH